MRLRFPHGRPDDTTAFDYFRSSVLHFSQGCPNLAGSQADRHFWLRPIVCIHDGPDPALRIARIVSPDLEMLLARLSAALAALGWLQVVRGPRVRRVEAEIASIPSSLKGLKIAQINVTGNHEYWGPANRLGITPEISLVVL